MAPRLGQSLSIHLPCRSQRQLIHFDKCYRYHVAWQLAAQQFEKICWLHGVLLIRLIVAHQLFRPGCRFPHSDNRAVHGRMLLQHGLDLARFDPESPNLHLTVNAAEKIEISIRTPSNEISGFVETSARSGVKSVGNEALRRQLRKIEISKRYAVTADVQLARDADWCKPRQGVYKGIFAARVFVAHLAMHQWGAVVKHIGLRSRDGTADWHPF